MCSNEFEELIDSDSFYYEIVENYRVSRRNFSKCVLLPKNRRTWTSIFDFSFKKSHILLVYLALALIGTFPNTEGYPASTSKGQSSTVRSQSVGKKPYWMNACSLGTANASGDKSSFGSLTPADKDTIDSIYMTALQGIVHANRFRNEYVMHVFSQPFSQVRSQYKNTYYTWLRGDFKMPKELNENMTEVNLRSLLREPQEVVVGMYQFLQRFAVAFEVMLSDHAEYADRFRLEFVEAEIHLKLLLCEIREFIDEDRLKSYRDVDRSIMKDELRHMKNHGQRHFRDWLIFRDYMNLLEYILQVMGYFRKVIQINAS